MEDAKEGVFEIWNHDMGLGPAEPHFMAVNEEDVGLRVVHDAEDIGQADMEEAEVKEQGLGGDALVNTDGEPVEVIEVQD
ncbi:hypothetical protein ACET3Z_025048 [Daucus carota]